MRKIFIFILLFGVLFSACTMNSEVMPIDYESESTPKKVEAEVIQNGWDTDNVIVTSLDELNQYRENEVISEKHYNFYYDLLSGESDVPAYNTLEITEFSIQFTVPLQDKTTQFDFTVAESGIDTLLPGVYSWKVRDGVVDGREPTSPIDQVMDIPAVKQVHDFVNSSGAWNTPVYGKSELDGEIQNYICYRYGEGYKVSQEIFARVAADEFGIIDKDIIKQYTEPWLLEDGCISMTGRQLSGWRGYVVSVEELEDTDEVVFQYYGDINCLLESYRVKYSLSKDGKWMGYTVIENSEYEPEGLHFNSYEMMLSKIVNEQFGLTLTLPEHWAEIAVVDATDNTEDSDFAHVFTLREKIAYTEINKGVVWTLLACPLDVGLEYVIEDAVTTDGLYLIGSDLNFRYLLTCKNDTYYSDLNLEKAATGEKQYYRLQNESKAVLSAFLQENEISVNSICPANRCYEPETVQLTEEIVNEYFGLTLTIPEHWNEIAFISAEAEESPASREAGPVLAFTLYEKIAYTNRIQAGNVWYLQAYPVGTEFEYAVEGVETVNGRLVIGTDDTYMYLIGFSTGVEYLMDDADVNTLTESQIRYCQLQEESKTVLTNFIETNGITTNEYYSIQDIKFQG